VPAAIVAWLAMLGGGHAQDWVVPISANSPHVVVSLTDERDRDDSNFFAINSPVAGGMALPGSGSANYEVFIYDTGAPATILSHEAFVDFGVAEAGRSGTNITPIGGVGGFIDAINSDPLGVYVAGVGAVLSTAPLAVDRSQLRGQYNGSVIYAGPGDTLPNLLGTPIASQYTTLIDYSQPQIVEIDGQRYRTPELQLVELGSAPRPTRRIGMRLEAGETSFPAPAFFPDVGNLNINDLGDNPSIPTVSGWFFVDADVENNGTRRSQLDMLLDTGAQGSFVSEQVAATLGFDVELDEPDFVVRVAGVTGTAEEIPGFIAEEFTLPGTGGGLTLENVPLIVYNIADPRDGFSTLPGLLGVNVLADRDLILNPEPGNSYLGISDPVFTSRRWSSRSATGDWHTADNWADTTVPDVSSTANLVNTSSLPQEVALRSDTTVGALNLAGQEQGGITVHVTDQARLTVFGTTIIQAGAELRLSDATLDPLAVEIRGGQISGQGTVGGEVLSQGVVVPGGGGRTGTLHFEASFDQLALGTLALEIGGAAEGDTFAQDLVAIDGDTSLAGGLLIDMLDSFWQASQPGTREDFTLLTASNVFGRFSSVAINGRELAMAVSGEGPSPPEHAGNGLFVELDYLDDRVVLSSYRALAGDADGDGEVQFADFVSLSNHYGGAGDWTEGDFNADGEVRFGDFVQLSNHYGSVVGPGVAVAAAVPEPAGTVLLWLALLGVLGLGRDRR
jgi:hypothetical protein